MMKTKVFYRFLCALCVAAAIASFGVYITLTYTMTNTLGTRNVNKVMIEKHHSSERSSAGELEQLTSQEQWITEKQGKVNNSSEVAKTSKGQDTLETKQDDVQPEVKHIAFLKVHKTGSSSVQNVLIRFGETRNLTFLLGGVQHNECEPRAYHCISFTRSLYDSNITPSPKNKSFDMLCSHVIFNRDRFRHYLPSDSKYIAIVRDPIRRLESAIAFFKLMPIKGGSLSAFAESLTRYNHPMTNNRMAFEFGFNRKWFPSESHKQLTDADKAAVSAYMNQVFKNFDLIMVNEHFDESLVLMKRLLRWNVEDIIYEKKHVYRHDNFSGDDEPMIRDYLDLDYQLYDRAVTVLRRKIAEAGPEFQDKVKSFQQANIIVNKLCNSEQTRNESVTVQGTQGYREFTVTRQFCDGLRSREVPYLMKMRIRQYGHV